MISIKWDKVPYSLVTGRLYVPFAIFIVATRTSPSFPLWTWDTLPRGHLVGTRLSSHRITISPTWSFLTGRCYFPNLLGEVKYSADHLCQKCWTRFWQRFQHFKRDTEQQETDGSGNAHKERPIRKCPGIRTSMPSSSGVFLGTSGWLFKHASICAKIVDNSSNVSFMSPMMWQRWLLALFTAASQSPRKCGACSGMNHHCMPRLEQVSAITWSVSCWDKKCCTSPSTHDLHRQNWFHYHSKWVSESHGEQRNVIMQQWALQQSNLRRPLDGQPSLSMR